MLPGKVSLLSLPRCQLGEVPHWDSQTNTLLYVDINQAVVNRWNPVSNAFKKIKVKGKKLDVYIIFNIIVFLYTNS